MEVLIRAHSFGYINFFHDGILSARWSKCKVIVCELLGIPEKLQSYESFLLFDISRRESSTRFWVVWWTSGKVFVYSTKSRSTLTTFLTFPFWWFFYFFHKSRSQSEKKKFSLHAFSTAKIPSQSLIMSCTMYDRWEVWEHFSSFKERYFLGSVWVWVMTDEFHGLWRNIIQF